ncbi:MAG: cytochrome c oxidase subunit II [Gemmataceae bacterium]
MRPLFADVPLFPEQASTIAPEVDGVTLFLTGLSAFFTLLIFLLILYFAVKYRRRSPDEIPAPVESAMTLEVIWTVIPLLIVLFVFVWSSRVYFRVATPPDNALEVYVVGQQWMWHLQHTGGQRENNELHVPAGRPVKLIMTSKDVIHDFAIPSFRVKNDVFPGTYTHLWFEATRPGDFRIFCAEYCGTDHSRMVGWVRVLEPSDFEKWLASPNVEGSLANRGRKLFLKLQCVTCHSADSLARAPNLEALFGKTVPLEDGRSALVDEAYLRRSILEPDADVVAGFRPIMPSFKSVITDEMDMSALIAFLKGLGPGGTPPRTERSEPPTILKLPPETKR